MALRATREIRVVVDRLAVSSASDPSLEPDVPKWSSKGWFSVRSTTMCSIAGTRRCRLDDADTDVIREGQGVTSVQDLWPGRAAAA